ncbi:MAG: shikimate dehydrogenase [Candidatus Gracilibacteria bacterium]
MQRFGIIANPVSHSLSPKLYSAAFEKYHIDATFEPILLQESELEGFLQAMRKGDSNAHGGAFDGLAVSHPFKEPCLKLMDEVDPVAQAIGAINTIKRVADPAHPETGARLIGYNTDWCGVEKSIDVALAQSRKPIASLKWKRILVLGAGGVARSAIYSFTKAGAHVFICNRTEEKGRKLAEKFGGEYISPSIFQYHEDSHEVSHENSPEIFDLIFQGTSLGMNGNAITQDISPLPISFWEEHGNGIAIESIYHPRMTRFLREADRAGWNIVVADHLFIGQAMKQFEILTGIAPDENFFQSILADF